MMTFAMLTESIFNWPGIGRWLLDAISTQDYVAIQPVSSPSVALS